MTLKNKNVVVTGGGRGIGAASAKLFASLGARVFVVSKTQLEIENVVKEIVASGGQAVANTCDVSDEKSVRHLFELVGQSGGADILINNAAVGVMKPFLKLTNQDWQKTIDVNVMGIVYSSRLAIEQMIPKKKGAIVNISSLGGIERLQKFEGFTAYSASKFAVIGLTECLAEEFRAKGIRVNCLAPGAVDTQMLRDAAPNFKTQTQPADVAKLIHFLADESLSGNMTGSILPYFCN